MLKLVRSLSVRETSSEQQALREIVDLDDTKFSLPKLLKVTRECCERLEDDVYLKDYIRLIHEAKKIHIALRVSGSQATRFNDKMAILAEHLKKDPENYATFKKMIRYEKEANLLPPSELYNKQRNATKTLLECHRMLTFMNALVEKLYSKTNRDLSASKISLDTYESMLAPYESLTNRLLMKSMFRLLPSRDMILSVVFATPQEHQLYPEWIALNERMVKFITDLYKDNNLLDIPTT